jgi:hypothetical protein
MGCRSYNFGAGKSKALKQFFGPAYMPRSYPPKRALTQAASLALHAAENDKWLEPLPEEHLEELDNIDQAHREAWQETDHFREYYGKKLLRIAEDDANLETLDCYESHYIPLLETFWDIWEEAVGFWDKVEKLRSL